jgi:uncharacterized phage protein (TIGR01671 family)
MREIKFRAWDGVSKMFVPACISGEYGHVFQTDRDYEEYRYFDSVILMQCTGLKDKNGKDIYEGDICKRNGHLRIIMFAYGSFMAYPTKDWQTEIDIDHLTAIHANWDLNNFISEIEVIGNIHENPELL